MMDEAVYCDLRKPWCDRWSETIGSSWYTISIGLGEPKTFCCNNHALLYIMDPVKQLDDVESVEPFLDKDGKEIF